MGAYVASQLIKAMIKKSIQIEGARVLIIGLTFKENCLDLRNTRVVDVIRERADYNLQIDVFDPWVNPSETEQEYGIHPIQTPEPGAYDGVVLAVVREQFKALGAEGIRAFSKASSVLNDLKYILPKDAVDLRL
jgi:UDP-N-acetyl-D-glucosamine/UDP-N-acetyl-D-galactosamine dehydrogenase